MSNSTKKATKNKAVKVQFDRDAAVAKIKSLHNQIVEHSRKTLQPAIEIGGKLLELKKSLKETTKDSWMVWCKKNLDIGHRTVTNYIKVYKAHKAGDLKGIESLIEAYEQLAKITTRKRKPSAAKFEVSAIKSENAIEWLQAEKEAVTTLKITAQGVDQFARGLKQGLEQHKDTLQKNARLVVVFELKTGAVIQRTAAAPGKATVVETATPTMPVSSMPVKENFPA